MKLYGIGHAMCDILISHISELPQSLVQSSLPALSAAVTHISGAEMAQILGHFTDTERLREPGGTSVNILKTAAALGGDCSFSGTTGRDAKGRDKTALYFQQNLAKSGIRSQLKTGTDYSGIFTKIQLADGKVFFAAAPGAAKQLTSDQIDETELSTADFIVIEGMLTLNKPVFTEVCRLCHIHNKVLFIDAASSFAAPSVAQNLTSLLDIQYILSANEDEACILKQNLQSPLDGTDVFSSISTSSQESPYPLILEKKGRNGSAAWMNGVRYLNLFAGKDAFDTTGAGDAFAGAFLTCWHTTKDLQPDKRLQKSLHFANTAAESVLDSWSCLIPQEKRKNLQALLARLENYE